MDVLQLARLEEAGHPHGWPSSRKAPRSGSDQPRWTVVVSPLGEPNEMDQK